ncbi:hypothetical protein [Kitasatospora cheerisanensis]|nr:hypothetical protein [Kitasatospora cheerisanensis]
MEKTDAQFWLNAVEAVVAVTAWPAVASPSRTKPVAGFFRV